MIRLLTYIYGGIGVVSLLFLPVEPLTFGILSGIFGLYAILFYYLDKRTD